MGFFPPYCIIIIINKKERTTEDFSCADVSFYAYNRSIRPFPWPLLKTALRCEWAEVLCQGQEWQQTHVCSPVNITPTEMWEEKRIWRGPCRSATRLLGRPLWVLDRWPGGTVLYHEVTCQQRRIPNVQCICYIWECIWVSAGHELGFAGAIMTI